MCYSFVIVNGGVPLRAPKNVLTTLMAEISVVNRLIISMVLQHS